MFTLTSRLYFNANIITLDRLRPKAVALLTHGNRIEKLFTKNPTRQQLPDKTERMDLSGKTILPGFTDSHIHFTWFARNFSRIDLSKACSKIETLDILLEHKNRFPKGEWVLGRGWTHNSWDDPSLPNAADLDSIFPENPVKLSSKCGHLYWVNSIAMKLADVNPQRTVKGGEILLDPTSGQPTGILKENAEEIIDEIIPEPSPELLKQMVLDATKTAHKLGITSMHVPETAGDFSILEQLHAEGKLKVRVCFYFPYGCLDDLVRLKLYSGFGDDWLRIGGIKLLLDGSLGGRTAWLFEPHVGEPDNFGIPCFERGELREIIRKANSNGISCAIHAIGDHAVAMTLECLDEVNSNLSDPVRKSLRNRIEHFQLVRPGDLAPLPNLNLYASMQPIHLCEDQAPADKYWGERARYAYAFKTIQEAGATLIFGSDAPVESPDPLLGIYAALTRKDMKGEPPEGWYAEERLPLENILRAYTTNPARASYEENFKGILKEGYLADFVVLSDDPFKVPPEATKDLRVEATVIDGEIVHRAFD